MTRMRKPEEPALQALMQAIAAERSGEATVEATPRDDHEQANGAAEQAVRLAQGHARTLMASLANSLGVSDLPHESPLVPWALRHGAWIYTHFVVGADGKNSPRTFHGEALPWRTRSIW